MTALSALLFSASNDLGPARGQLAADILGAPDEEVLRALRAGDEAVFERLYGVFRPRLTAIASAYVGDAIAEEFAQDVLMRVWEQRAVWTPQHGIAAYLYTSVRNLALKQLRRQGVAGRVARLAPEPDMSAPGMGNVELRPDEAVERDDLLDAIERTLSRLPELGRTAFTLRWIHQLAYDEIAVIMGTSEAAARKQVSRAREALIAVLRGFQTT